MFFQTLFWNYLCSYLLEYSDRSNHSQVFLSKGTLKHFTKSTGKKKQQWSPLHLMSVSGHNISIEDLKEFNQKIIDLPVTKTISVVENTLQAS